MGYRPKHYGLTGKTIMVRERPKKDFRKTLEVDSLNNPGDTLEDDREDTYEAFLKEAEEKELEEDIEYLTGGRSWKFPFEGLEVPVLVNGEYTEFLDCTVLPHRVFGRGFSRPYPITIDKFDIFKGIVIINGGSIK